MIIKNMCLLMILLSLIFILAQQELIYIIFSLMVFIVSSLGLLCFYQVEFLILSIFIIYIGVIVVLFLFTIIIYNLPKLELTIDALSIFGVGLGLFLLMYNTEPSFISLEYVTIDLVLFITFINEYFIIIIICGLLITISIITALVIINTINLNDY